MRLLKLSLIAGAVIAVTATAALAQTGDGSSAPLDRNNLHTIICQDYAPYTGSRIGPRVICLTNLEWQGVHRDARDAMMMEIKKSLAPGH